jgi:hypothetical protein
LGRHAIGTTTKDGSILLPNYTPNNCRKPAYIRYNHDSDRDFGKTQIRPSPFMNQSRQKKKEE